VKGANNYERSVNRATVAVQITVPQANDVFHS